MPAPPAQSQYGEQYSAPHAPHNAPSLHIQTNQPQNLAQQQPPYPPPQSRPPPPSTAQPSQTPSSAHTSAGAQSAGGFQPQSASSTYPLSPRSPPDSLPSQTPQAAAGKPLPFVRPSDIYRRMGEEKSRGSSESSRPSAEIGSNLSKQSSASNSGAPEPPKPQYPTSTAVPAPVPVSAPAPAPAPVSASQPRNVYPAPRTDSHTNVYSDLTSNAGQQTPRAPTAPVSQFATPRANVDAATDEEAKRLSTSPKLPDLARMSVFGADFFSSGFQTSLSSDQIAEQKLPDVPKVAPELKVDKSADNTRTSPATTSTSAAQTTQDAPDAPAAMANAPVDSKPSTDDDVVIQPTVYEPPVSKETPTSSAPPSEPKASLDAAKQATNRASIDTTGTASSRSAASAADITPTKPLNVRKEESPVRTFEPPPPLQREPTFGTDTSSPVKESDMLSDEIIKTLNSPGQSNSQTDQTGRIDDRNRDRDPKRNNARDSCYTLTDYDSYWADTDAAPPPEATPSHAKTMSIVPEEAAEAVEAVEAVEAASTSPSSSAAKTETKAPELSTPAQTETAAPKSEAQPSEPIAPVAAAPVAAPAAQEPEASVTSPLGSDLRRRFSWEAEDSPKPALAQPAPPVAAAPVPEPVAAPAPAPIPSSSPAAPIIAAAAAPAAAAAAIAAADGKSDSNESEPSRDAPTATVAPAPPTGPTQNARGIDVPAIITTGNDDEPKRLSLADEKALSKTSSSQISTPPPEDHPALNLSSPIEAPTLTMPKAAASVTPFKDIMDLNDSSERVAKFNETRVAFAIMDTGLGGWLSTLQQDHPEHISKSFNSYQPAAQQAGPGTQPPAQQPYYQQYLNASAPGGGSSPGRRIGGLSVPSNVGGSTFGHSGNQIGSKSKELMQSAGKMGKGLFSKGKSKLRGSGDKVFH